MMTCTVDTPTQKPTSPLATHAWKMLTRLLYTKNRNSAVNTLTKRPLRGFTTESGKARSARISVDTGKAMRQASSERLSRVGCSSSCCVVSDFCVEKNDLLLS